MNSGGKLAIILWLLIAAAAYWELVLAHSQTTPAQTLRASHPP